MIAIEVIVLAAISTDVGVQKFFFLQYVPMKSAAVPIMVLC